MDITRLRTIPSGGMRRPGPARLRGQAMVLFLVLSGVLCLGLILMFDTGQSVNKKVQLVNTADAAAYSVAVQEAKALNFSAYMNRGRVANEVTIAQMVSLWSWSNMLHTHTLVGYNLFTYLAGIAAASVVLSPAAPFLEAVARAYKVAEKIVATGRKGYHKLITVGGLIPGMKGGLVEALSALNGIFATATEAVLNYVGGMDGYLIATDVVEKNDPTAKFDLVGKALLIKQLENATTRGTLGESFLAGYSKDKDGGAGMDRFRNVVMASRDEFSADRGQNLDFWLAEIGTWGGTDMVDYERWAGMDTMFVEINLPYPLSDMDMPLGWGGAQAVNSRKTLPSFLPGIQSGENGGEGWYAQGHSGQPTYEPYGGSRGNTANLADDYPSVNTPGLWGASNKLTKKRDAYFEGYQGLQPYQDVKDKYAQQPEGKDAGPMFTVYIYSDRKDARTSEDIDGIGGPAGGALELKNDMANNRMTAISTAQAYFNRPPADRQSLFQRLVPREWNGDPVADSQLEKGSLFSPYWQARLVETPEELYLAAGISSLVGAP